MRNNAIGKIPASVEERKSSLHSRDISRNIGTVDQVSDRIGNLLKRSLIRTAENPHKFAEGMGRDSYHFRIRKLRLREGGLRLIVPD